MCDNLAEEHMRRRREKNKREPGRDRLPKWEEGEMIIVFGERGTVI